jgi:predicted DCC family thiol-disulfide oxidoreductase YuxK
MSVPTPLKGDAQESPMLIFDGACGFCQRSVQFILRHERRHDLLFVRRESNIGMQLRRAYGLEVVESMLWIESGQAFARSRSVVKVAAYLGGWWCGIARICAIFPVPLLDYLYRLVAASRNRLLLNPKQCLSPTPEQSSRFLA